MARADSQTSQPQSRLHHPDDLNITEFFKSKEGGQTLTNNSDLEATVPNKEKSHLIEKDRYWVNKPYAFIVIYESERDNEFRYYVVEPHLSDEENRLVTFLKDKLRVALNYNEIRTRATKSQRAITLHEESVRLLKNYNLITKETFNETDDRTLADMFNTGIEYVHSWFGTNETADETLGGSAEISDTVTLSRNQAEKVIYYVIRDFIRYDQIDPIMQDSQIEDISVSGWNSNAFVVHSSYDSMITNVSFGEEDLDEFVTTLAQKANKGISKRQPNVDATLEDGSRAILMLGSEITDKGTSFTIRQFNKIPFTPIDLINWETYSIEQMVYLWLAVESGKSAIIAGGTASGKTTTLNAISLFIPSTQRIVSIEDTREIQVPHKNWDPLMTRESVISNVANNIDEHDLLWNSLRMRPEYVIYGEVRGEEARSLFQNLNTGHTAFSTFHANSAKQVRVRMTTEPLNVDDTSFGGLDLILTQEEVSIKGNTQRRVKSIVELKEYDTHNDEFDVEKTYTWDQSTDEMKGQITKTNLSPLIREIMDENGWSSKELMDEINRRKVILCYLIQNDMNSYQEVSTVIQSYMNSKESILAQISNNSLKDSVSGLANMKNIELNVDPEKENDIPRPAPSNTIRAKARSIIDEHNDLYEDISMDIPYETQTNSINELSGDTKSNRNIHESDLDW